MQDTLPTLHLETDLPDFNTLWRHIISTKSQGLSETPLHFTFRYKGDSVGRYRRYPLRGMMLERLRRRSQALRQGFLQPSGVVQYRSCRLQ